MDVPLPLQSLDALLIYTFLHRLTDLDPITAGLLTGAVMSFVVDQGMSALLSFSTPKRDSPLLTHLRGFAAHLGFGLGVAGTDRRGPLLSLFLRPANVGDAGG